MFKIVVLVSGNGSNLQALIDNCSQNLIAGKIIGVICNDPNAFAIRRADNHSIPCEIIDHRKFLSREEFDHRVLNSLVKMQPDLIVLAGFMRILTNIIIDRFENKIINIHPSLLPKYPGLDTHKKVVENNDKFHGVTIHFVNSELDAGKIIAQGKIKVKKSENISKLIERIHKIEHDLLPYIVNKFATLEIEKQNDIFYKTYNI